MVDVSQCRGKDKQLNKPLCLAWSNSGRNHYITLVGVKGTHTEAPCVDVMSRNGSFCKHCVSFACGDRPAAAEAAPVDAAQGVGDASGARVALHRVRPGRLLRHRRRQLPPGESHVVRVNWH